MDLVALFWVFATVLAMEKSRRAGFCSRAGIPDEQLHASANAMFSKKRDAIKFKGSRSYRLVYSRQITLSNPNRSLDALREAFRHHLLIRLP